MRGEVIGLPLVGARAVAADDAGFSLAEVEVAIAKLELQVLVDVVGDARHGGVGEAEFAGGLREAISTAADAAVEAAIRRRDVDAAVPVGDVADVIVGGADAAADEGRQVVPGAKVGVGVDEEDRALHLAVIVVMVVELARHAVLRAGVIALDRVELLRGAVFTRGVDPEPIVELVADTRPNERRIADALLVASKARNGVAEIRARQFRAGVIVKARPDVRAGGDANADVAAQVPAAERDGLWCRNVNGRRRQVGGVAGRHSAERHDSGE